MTIATEKNLSSDRAEETVQTWQAGSWETFLALSQQPTYQKAKAYYFRGAYQFVMGVGANHAAINLIISLLVELYCIVRGIPFRGLTNASYRKAGLRECQPDSSFYLGDSVNASPTGREIANLDNYSPPDLVIEIADSSLADDLGMKRLLYEEMQVREYWVVDVSSLEILAFAIEQNMGSRRVRQSEVLQGLAMDAIAEALHKSQELDHAKLGQWWMEKIRG
jgi:Uma2 family endonuclease